MVEGAELEKKKKEFHDVSIQIIRLIEGGNFEDAQKFYNKTQKEWSYYYSQQFIKYMVTWNLIIYYINKYI